MGAQGQWDQGATTFTTFTRLPLLNCSLIPFLSPLSPLRLLIFTISNNREQRVNRVKSVTSAYLTDCLRVRALLWLGRVDEARPLIEHLRRKDWDNPDLEELIRKNGLGSH